VDKRGGGIVPPAGVDTLVYLLLFLVCSLAFGETHVLGGDAYGPKVSLAMAFCHLLMTLVWVALKKAMALAWISWLLRTGSLNPTRVSYHPQQVNPAVVHVKAD
jgi:hypothetical protein